ncbi:hypothetical protein ABS71_21580 [bacterium SCN 62-11]|nr:hybrid sensor histidine kinase/response regulator [Candidatus Eremiobacteraeota bacterium]ODT56688.1 MAG: hypothetical protein ABS71_21580 [bacterium SCN 62-11]
MIDLFRLEVETQLKRLNQDLLRLETSDQPAPLLESLMRACHSTKGAARLVGVLPAERLAHVMEDFFVAAQSGRVQVDAAAVDGVLAASDLLMELSRLSEADMADWEMLNAQAFRDCLQMLEGLAQGQSMSPPSVRVATVETPAPAQALAGEAKTLRLSAERLDRLIHLSGEAKVLSSWLSDLGQSMLGVKARNAQLQASLLEMESENMPTLMRARLESALRLCQEEGNALYDRLESLNLYERRLKSVTHNLFDEALATRMRPFSDGAENLPRLVRDLGRELGKEVRLEIEGLDTLVDREILERLETPLTHLLRNAIDHGLESAEERRLEGKPPVGQVRVQVYHQRGLLYLVVSDDGRGLDLEALRSKLVERGLSTPELSQKMTPHELTEFIFLPGFSSRSQVTAISGRGVGLDLVRQSLAEVGGQVTCEPQDLGVRFEIQLPLALSILHCLLVEVSGQSYALPLARLERVARLQSQQITSLEGRPWWTEESISLTLGARVLGLPSSEGLGEQVSVVVFRSGQECYGLVVDRLLDKQKLVAQPIDKRLGKLQHVLAGTVLQNGEPALILDVEDLVHSMAKMLQDWQHDYFPEHQEQPQARKRVLVVDDSITVREVERNLLKSLGLEVDIAVDGVDGWNAVRQGGYDLVVSDVDMPRMDGIELVRLIRADAQLAATPVLIVSYKDREEDRLRGLEAGADGYLTKASFHDHKFTQAVRDLVG